MPVPNIYEDGAAVHGVGPLSVPWGTHNAQFHAVMLVTSAGQPIATPTSSDTTWTLICEAYVGDPGVAGSVGAALFWAPSTSDGGMTNATVADTGDHTSAKMWMLQNVSPTGNPINMTATQTIAIAQTAISMAAPNTTVVNCLVFIIAAHAVDTLTNPGGSGWANAAMDGGAPGFGGQYTTTNGVGGGYMGAQGEKAAAGSCGTFTHNWSIATKQANLIFAISDTATAGGSPQSMEPLPASAGATGVDPALTPGDVAIGPLPASGTATGVDPSLTAGDVVITADPAPAAATGVDPALTPGDVGAAPLPASATAAGVDPSLTAGDVSFGADAASAAAVGVDPALTPGAVLVTPEPASATATGVDPTLDASTFLELFPASATATGVDPALTPGDASFEPLPAAASAAGVDPDLREGVDASFAPAPASGAATGVDPVFSSGVEVEGVVIGAWPATIEVPTVAAQLEVSARSATIEVK